MTHPVRPSPAPVVRLGFTLGVLLLGTLLPPGCNRRPAGPAPAPDAGAAKQAVEAKAPAPDPEEACVDAWLAARKLDRFGHPEGTMYAGGTPLFDEGTGEEVDRLVYVYGQQPGAQAACAPEPAEPAGDGGAPATPGVQSPP